MKRTRILLADDHGMLLDALATLLNKDFDIVGVARDGATLLDMVTNLHPELVVTDVAMPDISGIEASRAIRKNPNPPKILFLSMYSDLPLVEDAFRAGASGYVLKSCGIEELVRAINWITRGGTYVTPSLGDSISVLITTKPHDSGRPVTLTPRQREVLQLLAEGQTMKEIGRQLNITTRTAESHKYEIMRNLGVKTTAELIRYAIRTSLVQSGEKEPPSWMRQTSQHDEGMGGHQSSNTA